VYKIEFDLILEDNLLISNFRKWEKKKTKIY